MTTPKMSISVLLPTYCRPQDLRRCLEALLRQTRPADEVLVIARDTDEETAAVLECDEWHTLCLRKIVVTVPGQVHALNTGLSHARGDIIALTDDDAAPRPEWLARIVAHFEADPRVGGVGGRDWVHHGDRLEDASRQVVGKVQWFGRVIGNHHLGVGGPRSVEVLKGANMSYRRAAVQSVRFDARLRGPGAQVHNDLAFSLAVKKAGWMIVYDPEVAIDHYAGTRFDNYGRGQFHAAAQRDAVHNETLALLEYLTPLQRAAYMAYALLLGTRDAPGLLQVPRRLMQRGHHVFARFAATFSGRLHGMRAYTEKGRHNRARSETDGENDHSRRPSAV